MCTAVTYRTADHYFGRNLDLEYSYQETVTITPRKFPLHFRSGNELLCHHAIIGIATVADNYPLYYDAVNEHGLAMAGLNFPGTAHYCPRQDGKDNITPFEFVPWILGQCTSVEEAQIRLSELNMLNKSFSAAYPLSPLHWIIADRDRAITVEPMSGGLRIYDNPVGILTNNPPFDYHMYHLTDFMNLTNDPPVNRMADNLTLTPYSLGLGAMGLPGDLSSASRFIKAAFTKLNSISGTSEHESISQFFHILDAVSQQRGCVRVQDKDYEITQYSTCYNTDKGVCYYSTYENRQITAVELRSENLSSDRLISYPLIMDQQIRYQNKSAT